MENIRIDGTLDYKCFIDELYKFYEIVIKNPEENVNWQIKKFSDDAGGIVLIRKSLVKSQIKENFSGKEDYLNKNEDQLEETDEKGCEIFDQNLLSMEHQIVYSLNYSVPVLYFKSCFLNGRSLKVEEIWNQIPMFCNQFDNNLNEDELIKMITQFEHPILQKPFFAVHPCKTNELMSSLFKSFDKTKMNYILSWLSTIGPISGLNLNLKSI